MVWQTIATRYKNTITSRSLNSATINWTGAELALWTTTYRLARHKILSESGNNLVYNTVKPENTDFFQNSPGYFLQNFFIENDPRTLDVQNEWYYNPSQRLRIYLHKCQQNVSWLLLTL